MRVFHLARFARDQFPLWVFRAPSHRDYPRHAHDFTELALALAGEGIHVGPDGEYPFRAGDVFVIETGAAHAYRETRGLSLVNIMFDAGRLRLPDHDFRQLPGYHALFQLGPRARKRGAENLRLNAGDLRRVDRLSRVLERELMEQRPGYQSMSVALLAELIVFLSRQVEGTDDRGRNIQAIGKALGCIERQFAETPTLEYLAKQAGMSIRNFQRRFKEAVGVTPFRRLLEIRVGRAKALLRDPALTVSEVAFSVGFQDSNYFCRQFKSVEGMSPGRYRELAKKKA